MIIGVYVLIEMNEKCSMSFVFFLGKIKVWYVIKVVGLTLRSVYVLFKVVVLG